MPKLVQGVGLNDLKGTTNYTDVDGKKKAIPSYTAWKSVLKRAYSEEFKKKQPTYKGVTVCDSWKTFSNFKSWYDKHYVDGYALDKDLLVEGNKIYSPETCSYVPVALNNLFTDSAKTRGELPIGVTLCKKSNKYKAQICKDGKGEYLGLFPTPESAHNEYVKEKKKYSLEKIEYYKGLIPEELVKALVKRINQM